MEERQVPLARQVKAVLRVGRMIERLIGVDPGIGFARVEREPLCLLVSVKRLDRVLQLDEIEHESSTHAQAYAILQEFAEHRSPFALLLRGFGPEAAESVSTTPDSILPGEAIAERDSLDLQLD